MTAPVTASSRPDNKLRLRDGRMVTYAEYGVSDGVPVFLFHGTPASRLQAALAHDDASRHRVRLVCPDRPGYGGSSFRRGTLLEYVDDVVELADALECSRFAVIGTSGGGPYAAACASRIPERLAGAAIVCGVGPLDAPDSIDLVGGSDRSLVKLARRAPWAVGPLISAVAFLIRHAANRLSKATRASLPDDDRAVLDDPPVSAALRASTSEAVRRGGAGWAWDVILISRPWGFRLEDIAMPVLLIHGELDANVLPEMARRQAAAIPNCETVFWPDAGHLRAALRMGDVLERLVRSS